MKLLVHSISLFLSCVTLTNMRVCAEPLSNDAPNTTSALREFSSSDNSIPNYVAPRTNVTDEPLNPLTTLGQPALQGQAQVNVVSGKAHALTAYPLTNCHSKKIEFIELTVRNDSSQIAFIDGNATQAILPPSSPILASSPTYLGTTAKANISFTGKVLVAAVTLPSIGLFGPIFYEMLTPAQHAKRYMGRAIGFDGVRHEIEGNRFGLRMILPGDESAGWIAFENADHEKIEKVVVPVSFSIDRVPAGSLIISVIRTILQK